MVCKGFFQALEACHADNWRKWTGGCNNDKNELNMCLRKVVRFPFSRRYVSVPLTGVDAATRGFGTKPGAREGTTEENTGCVEGAAPRRLDGLHLRIPSSCRRVPRYQRHALPTPATPLISLHCDEVSVYPEPKARRHQQ